jgi:methionyl aminopeptidase
MDKEKILKAGKITSDVRAYAKTIVKKGIPLLEIADKIETRIVELGGQPAFPVNLSINEIAAHYTPSYDDKTLASGLIKVDFGVSVDGWPADNSFSVDLDGTDLNKKLILASEQALKKALEIVKPKITTDQIGEAIQKTIEASGFSPIINLCGHSMEKNELHAGITIPNINDNRGTVLKEGLYAIEPFATTGSGKIREGKPSGIYNLQDTKKPRSPEARELLIFIDKEYKTLPFCSRWIVKKFGHRALISLNELEANGNLHHFHQLVEISGTPVSQMEHTILIEKDKVIVTTL